MRFLAPGWIGLAAVASLVVVAIHLIAWRLPRSVILPTARFVPDEPARRAARTIRLADLALLALRVAVVMLGGVAMARPMFESRPSGSATVIALAATDGDSVARRDGLRAVPRGEHTTFIVFDTTARVLSEAAALSQVQRSTETSLTVGLLTAIREARRLQQEYDTVRIVVVAPFLRSSFDHATHDIRATWPDTIRVIRIQPAAEVSVPARVDFSASGDDPVVAGIRLAQSNGLIRGQSRVVRQGVVVAPAPGEAVVMWPKARPNDSARVAGVHTGDVTAISHFIPVPLADSGRVIARWVNGVPAAREVVRAGGCVRSVGFDVPDVGDFVLSPSFQRLAAELLAPCGGLTQTEVASDSVIAALTAPSLDTRAEPPPPEDPRNRVAAILMLLAALLGIAELLVRRWVTPAIAELHV